MSKPKKCKVAQPTRLDLGCGNRKQDGFIGVDLYAPNADIKCDLFKFPWPWKDNTVDEIYCSHFLEHVPRILRKQFMEECWRIMKLEATMRIIVPNWKSERALGDMTHEPPAVVAMFFFYLNRNWREANLLTYGPYDFKCNFDHQAGAAGIVPAFADKHHEAQMYALTHYLESYQDMWATLTKRA